MLSIVYKIWLCQGNISYKNPYGLLYYFVTVMSSCDKWLLNSYDKLVPYVKYLLSWFGRVFYRWFNGRFETSVVRVFILTEHPTLVALSGVAALSLALLVIQHIPKFLNVPDTCCVCYSSSTCFTCYTSSSYCNYCSCENLCTCYSCIIFCTLDTCYYSCRGGWQLYYLYTSLVCG